MIRRAFLGGAAERARRRLRPGRAAEAVSAATSGRRWRNRAEFVAWMAANRGEDADARSARATTATSRCSLRRSLDPREKRAFLMTPREEFVLPEDRDHAYVGHYLDIGFGVTITPPGTWGG